MNKEKLIEFYNKRFDYLIEIAHGAIDLDSISNEVIFDPYIDEKDQNPIMVIGNLPRANEGALPFNGRSKELLYEILEKCGISRQQNILTTNAFPFALTEMTKKGTLTNRAPSSMETLIGSLLLIKEIELVQPKLIIALGETAFMSLKYINDQTFLNSIESLTQNHFVISKLNCLNNNEVIVGISHYPNTINIKNPLKKNDLVRFFKRVALIYTEGFDKLTTHKKNGFVAEYDNYSDIREYCEEVATMIFSDNLLPTPKIYEEYFYRILDKKNKEFQTKIKQALTIEKHHYSTRVKNSDFNLIEDRMFDAIYGVHSKEYFEEELEKEIMKAEIDGKSNSSVLIIKTNNIDDFDEYSKMQQEKIMISVLKQQVRGNDLLANSDVDTFVILLRYTSGEQAKSVQDRIYTALQKSVDLKLDISVKLEMLG